MIALELRKLTSNVNRGRYLGSFLLEVDTPSKGVSLGVTRIPPGYTLSLMAFRCVLWNSIGYTWIYSQPFAQAYLYSFAYVRTGCHVPTAKYSWTSEAALRVFEGLLHVDKGRKFKNIRENTVKGRCRECWEKGLRNSRRNHDVVCKFICKTL